MKKSSGKRALSQGVLSVTTKDAGRNISKHGNCAAPSKVESKSMEESQDENGTNITPRVTTPSKSVCVDQPKALTELSLSDAEINGHEGKHKKLTPKKIRQSGAEVLVTETNSENGMTGIEVETRSFKMPSPARVICHSASSLEGIVPDSLVATNKPTSVSLDEEVNGADGIVKESSKTKTNVELSRTKINRASMKKKKYLPVQSRYKLQSSKDPSLEFSVIPPQADAIPASGMKKVGGRTHSTPYLMNSIYEGQTTTDGSILDTTAFQVRALVAEKASKKVAKKNVKTKGSNDSSGSKDSSSDLLKKSKSKDSAPLSQLALDLHYSRLLQMAYVSMKAKQTFDKQEEKAKTDLYGLWSINCKLEKEIKTLQQSVELKTLEVAVDQLLRAQVEGLGQIENKFSKVMVNTSKLSDALSNTAHYLPVKNVIIDEGKLMDALEESKKLLAELTALTRVNQPEIEELAKTADVLKKTLCSELSEQKICTELLAACNSLTNQERSLQVQVIQVDD